MTENTNEIISDTPNIDETATETISSHDVLSIGRDVLSCIALNVFILSPIIQLFIRFFGRSKISRHQYPDLIRYQSFIDNTNRIMFFAAIIIFIAVIGYGIYERVSDSRSSIFKIITSKSNLQRLTPYFLLIAFAVGIILVTLIRGTNDWDMTGHWYTHESIFSYIIYAIAYFFCGMMVFSDKVRRVILYILIFSSLPLHILALVDEWGSHITYFDAQGLSTGGVTTVFFNSNHYGYYLAITILASALMFVYEQRTGLKIFSAICGIIATMVLIINNTLGAYLAVLFVLFIYIAYCIFFDRKNRSKSIILLIAYVIITIVMSFHYDTILSSLFVLSDDVGQIIADPTTADSAGSSRWKLWKGTVTHMPEHPLVGFGVEGLLQLYGIGTPHNEFLQYMEFFGIPVMLLYMTACAVVLWRVFKNIKDMSSSTIICFFISIGYLTSSFFGVAIFYTTPFFYIMLGLTYAEYLSKGFEPANDPGNNTDDGINIVGTDKHTEKDNNSTTDTDNEKNTKKQADIKDASSYDQGYSDGLDAGLLKGAELELISIVCIQLQKGHAVENIASELDEDNDTIQKIYEAVQSMTSDYNSEDIYRQLH